VINFTRTPTRNVYIVTVATKSVTANHMEVQRKSSNYPLVRILNRKANKVTSQTTQTCNSIRSLHNDRLLGIITCMLMGVQYGEAFAQVCRYLLSQWWGKYYTMMQCHTILPSHQCNLLYTSQHKTNCIN